MAELGSYGKKENSIAARRENEFTSSFVALTIAVSFSFHVKNLDFFIFIHIYTNHESAVYNGRIKSKFFSDFSEMFKKI